MARTLFRLTVLLFLTVLPVLFSPSAIQAGPATMTFSDGEFSSGWVQVVESAGPGGTGSFMRVGSGGAPGAHMSISTTLVANLGGPEYFGIYAFQINTAATYDPSVSGEIVAIDYSESSRTTDLAQRVAPALRQNGKLYVSVETDMFTEEYGTRFVTNELFGLTAASFRTQWSIADHPDFSASGAPIEFGCLRAIGGSGTGPGYTRVGELDNWKVVVNPLPGSQFTDEIRAEAHFELKNLDSVGGAIANRSDVDARPPQSLADQVRAALLVGDTIERFYGDAESRASMTSGTGCTSHAFTMPGSVEYVRSRTLASRTRRLTATSSNPGAPPSEVSFDLFLITHGQLALRSLAVNNQPAIEGHLFAEGRSRVVVHRATGDTEVFFASARLTPEQLIVTGPWAGSISDGTDALGQGVKNLDYAELRRGAFSIPYGETFSVTISLETETYADSSSVQWAAYADFWDTQNFEISTDTPGIEIVEVFTDANPQANVFDLAGKRTVKLGGAGKSKGTDQVTFLLDDGGTWALEDGDHLYLHGTWVALDSAGRKLDLTVDGDIFTEALEVLGRVATRDAGKDIEILLNDKKAPKLRLTTNKKGTKTKLSATFKSVSTGPEVKGKGLYKLKAKATVGGG